MGLKHFFALRVWTLVAIHDAFRSYGMRALHFRCRAKERSPMPSLFHVVVVLAVVLVVVVVVVVQV